MSPTNASGKITTCAAKNRYSVLIVTSWPPRKTCNSQLPNKGTDLTMFVPTVVAKYASLFHGSRYPENPKPSVSRNRKYPDTHVISRGGRYAFSIIVLNM